MPGAHPAAGQPGQHLRVTLAGDQRGDHVLRRQRGQLGRHRRYLDQRVLQQLLQPLPAPGPVLDQVGPGPGVVPQRPDLGRRHEDWAAAAPSRSAGPATSHPAGRSWAGRTGASPGWRTPAARPAPPPPARNTRSASNRRWTPASPSGSPAAASWPASALTAFIVAGTGQTVLLRAPRPEGCGALVHTIPEAFATSTAATRSRTSSWSSSSITCGLLTAASLCLCPMG